ncbi:MAG: S1C family serine protease [Candidatus Nitrosopolaris sp.]
MATKISIVSLSIATAIVAILLIQTAFRGSNMHALGQAGVSGMDLVTRNPPRPPLTQIFKQVENSVVQITARTPNPNLQVIINGNPLGNQSTRMGSGFVYDKEGRIITNNHAIDGASTADVTFVDGNTYGAKVIGKDPSSDIAVLQITTSDNL